jgi:hypothetical protein
VELNTSIFRVENQSSTKPACSRLLGSIKMEVICSSETPVHIRNMRRCILEDRNSFNNCYFTEVHPHRTVPHLYLLHCPFVSLYAATSRTFNTEWTTNLYLFNDDISRAKCGAEQNFTGDNFCSNLVLAPFEPRQWHRLSWLRHNVVSCSPSWQLPELCLKLDHDHIASNPLLTTIVLSEATVPQPESLVAS